jgi:hypothetical protein
MHAIVCARHTLCGILQASIRKALANHCAPQRFAFLKRSLVLRRDRRVACKCVAVGGLSYRSQCLWQSPRAWPTITSSVCMHSTAKFMNVSAGGLQAAGSTCVRRWRQNVVGSGERGAVALVARNFRRYETIMRVARAPGRTSLAASEETWRG